MAFSESVFTDTSTTISVLEKYMIWVFLELISYMIEGNPGKQMLEASH